MPKEHFCLFTAVLFGLLMGIAANCGAADITFNRAPDSLTVPLQPAIIADVNGDDWLEPLGGINDGSGHLSSISVANMRLNVLFVPGTPDTAPLSDARFGDFNGDGIPDLVTQSYASTNADVHARLFINDGLGHYSEDADFGQFGFRGKGEGLLVADFNNDGALDIYLPFYTYPCSSTGASDTVCPNAQQSYLLLNDGAGRFTEVADAAGVAMRAPAGVSVPPNTQPEGGQGADLNDDGRIDIYIAGKIYLNDRLENYNDPNTGRSVLLPRFNACDCGIAIPNTTRTDEGAKILDWNNDGKLDLLLHHWNNGPTLYESDGSSPSTGPSRSSDALQVHYQARPWTTDSPSSCMPNSGNSNCKPLFTLPTAANAVVPFQDSFGINIYDLDNDGLEDIFISASPNPPINDCPPGSGTPCAVYPHRIFRNNGSGFVDASAGDLSAQAQVGIVSFVDINKDNRIDVFNPSAPSYYLNNTAVGNDSAFAVEVLSAEGARNQHGRVVRVLLPKAGCGFAQLGCTLAKVVDSGSGYHSQNQYPLLFGTPYVGARHHVSALLPFDNQLVEVAFDMFPGQRAKIYAPSSGSPNGRWVVEGVAPPDPTSAPAPTLAPTNTPTPTSTPTATAQPTNTPTPTSTPTATTRPTNTPTPTSTPTVTPRPTNTPTPTSTPTATPRPMSTPVPTPRPTGTPTPTPRPTSTPTPTPTPTPTVVPASARTFTSTMVLVRSGKCLDVANASTSDSATLQQYTCNGRSNQQVRMSPVTGKKNVYQLAFVNSGKCLTSTSSNSGSGSATQRRCSNTSSQQYKLQVDNGQSKVFTVIAQNNGMCLGVPFGSTSSTAKVQFTTCSGSSSLRWRIAMP
jgi:hypothetical protein